MKKINDIKEKILQGERKSIAVANACDLPVLKAIKCAIDAGLATAVLVGDEKKIKQYLERIELGRKYVTIVNESEPYRASQKAVKLVRDHKAQVLMKGLVGTADFMKCVLNKECGLRGEEELTHVSVFEVERIDRLIIMTDPAMHTYPGLEEKVKMLKAAAKVCQALEIPDPKAAVVCAIETVNPAMPPTLDAAALTLMSTNGQIPDITVEGPLALDLALSKEAAEHKGIKSPVAGQADVLLMPNIESGNVMWKTLVYMGDAKVAGVIVGAAAPIILTSRSDSNETKLNSIMLALLMGRVG